MPSKMRPSSCDSPQKDVLILGASARAAAKSAVRAGFRVFALDLFGDEDLIESVCEYRKITHYRDCFEIIADWPMMPCLVTGALENHPRLIDRLAEQRPFWGTPADVIRQVRNPHRLREALSHAGLPALVVWPGKSPPVPDVRWMLKPKRSAGGQGIFVWDQHAAMSRDATATLRKPHYFQRRAEGEAASAVFLSEWNQITFVGASKLLHANPPGPRFGYGGAIGPVDLPQDVMGQLIEVGRILGEGFALRGLWGLDFLHDASQVWVTEVNPRYTATVELYEHAYGTALLPQHRLACEEWTRDREWKRQVSITTWANEPDRRVCVGKVVVYSPIDFVVPPWKDWTTARDPLLPELNILADRPMEGSRVPNGFPVCSLLASGATPQECGLALVGRVESLADHFKASGVDFDLGKVTR